MSWEDRLTGTEAARIEKHSMRVESGCHEWTASLKDGQYGSLRIRGGTVQAHKVACYLAHGPALNREALHSCDNPRCVNPEHLRWGTRTDNLIDRRNRTPHKGQVLNEELVMQIKTAPGSQREVAARFGIRQPTVSRIRSGVRWGIS